MGSAYSSKAGNTSRYGSKRALYPNFNFLELENVKINSKGALRAGTTYNKNLEPALVGP